MARTPEPGKAFLFSAVLPGAGQWFMDQDRWPAYLAVEAVGMAPVFGLAEGGYRASRMNTRTWLGMWHGGSVRGPRSEAGWEY